MEGRLVGQRMLKAKPLRAKAKFHVYRRVHLEMSEPYAKLTVHQFYILASRLFPLLTS